MTRSVARKLAALAVSASLVACGGGGGGDEEPSVSPGGGYVGVLTSTTTERSIEVRGMVGENGRMVLIGTNLPVLYFGTVSTRADMASGTYRAHVRGGDFRFENGQSRTTGRLDGSILLDEGRVDGAYTEESGGAGTFSLGYTALTYEIPSSLPILAGTWTAQVDSVTYTFGITSGGVITGNASNGCMYSGGFTIIDPDYAPLNAQLTETCGGTTRTLTGLGWRHPPGVSAPFEVLYLGVANTDKAFFFGLRRVEAG